MENYYGLNLSHLNVAGASSSSLEDAPAQSECHDGPETVPGAAALLEAGFEALESLTGQSWIIESWPTKYKLAIPETRPDWLNDSTDKLLWFVQSPWPSVTAQDALSVVWANLPTDQDVWVLAAKHVLEWPRIRALQAMIDHPW